VSPGELEAVAVAADALDGAGDPAALVVALVAELARRGRLPENEVAVTLARLIEAHPEGAGLVRYERRVGATTEVRSCGGGDYTYTFKPPGGPWMLAGVELPSARYDTREAVTRDDVWALLDSARFTFGIQPDTEAILVEMLSAGASWPEIGRVVGWDPDTLRTFWVDLCEARAATAPKDGGATPSTHGGRAVDDVARGGPGGER
jgi:hypothetical protein